MTKAPARIELPEPFLADVPEVGDRAHPEVWATENRLRWLAVALDFVSVFICYYATFGLITGVLKIHIIVPWVSSPLVPLYLSVFVLFYMQSIQAYRDRRFITDPGDWLNIVIAAGLSVATALV